MEIALDQGLRANLPIVNIPYVFHYIQYNDESETCITSAGDEKDPPVPGTRFEMICNSADQGYGNVTNVVNSISTFQDQLNDLLENMSESYHGSLTLPYSGVVGDTRFRMILGQTGPQAGALHCADVPGVYIWESIADLNNSGLLLNSSAQAVIVYGGFRSNNTSDCNISASASRNGAVNLYQQLTPTVIQNGIPSWVESTLFHEFAHTAGVDHAFDQNVCTDIDLGDPSTFYGQFTVNSNNLMDYNWPNPSSANPPVGVSISPCQWSTMYCEFLRRFGNEICEKQDGVLQFSEVEEIGSTTPITINKNIEVLAGGDLTLKGTIKFAPGVAIVVRRGGRLTVDNALLSRCNTTEAGRWKGIFIEGNYGLEQPGENTFPSPPESAGIVRMYISRIDGTYTALQTYRYEPSTDVARGWERSYWGGVMYVRDSEFTNNTRAAEFMKYGIKNKSLFHGTQFYGDRDAILGNRAITAWATHGVEIDEGCGFYEFDDQAIYSINAFFDINNSAFRNNHETIVLEYTRSHLSDDFSNKIGTKGMNEITDNFGAIAIIASDYQFRNNSEIVNNFVSNSENYYVETYGRGLINIDHNSFSGATGDSYIWSIHPSLPDNSINCNTLTGLGGKFRGLAISGNQSETSVEGNVISGLERGLTFRWARGVFFSPKLTQGVPNRSHGNYWLGNTKDISRDNTRSIRDHAELTFFTHTFDEGQSSNFNPNNSASYGGDQFVVMERAFFDNDCTEDLEVVEPEPPTSEPCEQFAEGGLSPDNPQQKENLGLLFTIMEEAYSSVPVDGNQIADLVDCLTEEDKIRLYYLSLNYTHDEELFQAVKNSESFTYSDIAGLERARQVWLFENSMLGDEELLEYYEITCDDSKLAMPYLREHNFVIHQQISSPDYLSCSDREYEGQDSEFENEESESEGLADHHDCATSCKNVGYTIVDMVSGDERTVLKPAKLTRFDFDKPYRYLKVTCPDHGSSLTRKIE